MRRPLRPLLAGLLAVVAALSGGLPARADGDAFPLDDGNKGLGSWDDSPGGRFSLTTTSPYWSGIVLLSDESDYDLSISAPGSPGVLAASNADRSTLDFVAIDSNLRAPGPYLLDVTRYSGSNGRYTLWWRQTNQVLPPASATVYTLNQQWLMIRDVHLNAGECLAVRASRLGDGTGDMFLMASDPAKPVQSRADAVVQVHYTPADAHTTKTLLYTATRAGWYGFIIANNPTTILTADTILQYQRLGC